MRLLGCLLLLILLPARGNAVQAFTSLTDCEKEALQCITYSEGALASAEPQSSQWYHLKNLNLAAHWQLLHLDVLRQQLPDLADIKEAPAVFKVTVMTIYSKLLLNDGKLEQGHQMVSEVIKLIEDVNAVSLSPDRYAELLVLLHYVKKYDEAERIGQQLLTKLSTTRRNIELGDFYTALGHTQFGLGNYLQSEQFYQQALVSYTEQQHVLEISNTLHNIARCYQSVGQHEDAVNWFEKSLQWKAKAGEGSDHRSEQYTRLRLVQSLFHANRPQLALDAFRQINTEHVLTEYQGLYQEVAQLIGAN